MYSKLSFLLIAIITVASCKTMRVKQQVAWNHLDTLKNGVLLVRLQDGKNTIAALKKAGLSDRAKAASDRFETVNESLKKAFQTQFDFCPVYFFNSDDSKKVLNGQLDGILMTATGKKIPTPNFQKKQWLVAEYGFTQDPLVEEVEKDGPPIASTGIKGLVIKDQTFRMLEEPFPSGYKVFAETEPAIMKSVRLMNNSLKGFEMTAKKKKLKRKFKEAQKGF